MIRGTMISRPASALLDLLFPPACAACGCALPREEGSKSDGADIALDAVPGLCADCTATLPWLDPPFCAACAEPLPSGQQHLQLCAVCLQQAPTFDFAVSACWNREPIRRLVHHLKYTARGRRLDIVIPLAHILQRTVADDRLQGVVRDRGNCLVVPVPLSGLRYRERGFNQAQALAEEFSRIQGLMPADILRRHRHTGTQTHLTREDRAENLRNAFSLKSRCQDTPEGKTCLLIDDILTTGSTLSACARVLKSAGAARVIALAVGRTAHR
jgi:ComF family protein